MPGSVISFTGVAALLVMAPGVDFALVLRTSLMSRRQGLLTSLGVANGLVVHTFLAVVGVSALLMTETAQFWLFLVSGLFLTYLGVRGLIGVVQSIRKKAQPTQQQENLSGRSAFQRGFLVNTLNPKAPVLFLSIMPQFIPGGGSNLAFTALLGFIVVACALLWFPLVALASHRMNGLLTRPRVALTVDLVTVGVILTLGIKQLWELL